MTATNQTETREEFDGFDAEELAMLDATLSKIKGHLDRNIEGSNDPQEISRLLSMRYYINQSY